FLELSHLERSSFITPCCKKINCCLGVIYLIKYSSEWELITFDSFLRTGFIVGHPGESDADFEELCEFIKDFGFDRVSVFAYSK
ncbi:hypothetical protein, partial [Campylobacter coli]|uniref:hypothetical protein n=1 Tax=Campylobacter coli TaxID=195 RepID=UPI002E3652C4